MKKIFKNPLLTFILGAIIFGGITSVSAYTLYVYNIRYTPSDTEWKKADGTDITNVKDAIDELYNACKAEQDSIVWTDVSSSFSKIIRVPFENETINYDFSKVKAVRVIIDYAIDANSYYSVTMQKKNTEYSTGRPHNEERIMSFNDTSFSIRRAGESTDRLFVTKIYVTNTDFSNIPTT